MRKAVWLAILFAVIVSANMAVGVSETADKENEYALQNAEYTAAIMQVIPETGDSGEETLVVTLEWSHDTDATKTFWLSVAVEAYQGGVALTPLFPQADLEEQLKEIDSGTTQEVHKTFQLSDKNEEVQILLKIPGVGGAAQDEMTVDFPLEYRR